MRFASIVLATFLAWEGNAWGQPAAASPQSPVHPNCPAGWTDWLHLPSAEDLVRIMPSGEHEGFARMRCTVGENGRFTGCNVLEEQPSGRGFSDAALKLSSYFRVRPTNCEGEPSAGKSITIPIHFSR